MTDQCFEIREGGRTYLTPQGERTLRPKRIPSEPGTPVDMTGWERVHESGHPLTVAGYEVWQRGEKRRLVYPDSNRIATEYERRKDV